MLQELCKRDKEWRKMALYICKSKDLADDLVQEMYLYFANHTKKINQYYVFFTIKHLYIRSFRNQITKVEYDSNLLISEEYDNEKEDLLNYLEDNFERLDFFDKELLKLNVGIEFNKENNKYIHSKKIPLRQLEKETDISFMVIHKNNIKTKKKLWEELKKLKD